MNKCGGQITQMASNNESEEKPRGGLFGGKLGEAIRALQEGPMRNLSEERTPTNEDDEGKDRRPNNGDK